MSATNIFDPNPQFGPQSAGQAGSPFYGPVYNPALAGKGKKTGDVLGTTTGGGGGGNLQSLLSSAPYEQAPEDTSDEDNEFINKTFAPALSALSDFASSLQSQLPGQIANTEAEGEQLKTEAQAAGQGQLGELGIQKTTEEGKTKSAISEARRQAAEMMQGLQARFGGTTGTGGFVGELLGREALRNISENRAALQNTLARITQAENQVKTQVNNLVTRIDLETRSAIQRLRDGLVERLGQINIARGELEARKGERKLDLLKEFRDRRAEIEARNAQLKQDLFTRYQETSGLLKSFAATQVKQHETALKAFLGEEANVTETSTGGQQSSNLTYVPSGGGGGLLPDDVDSLLLGGK